MTIYDEVSRFLEQQFRDLEGMLPKPNKVDLGAGPTLRYEHQNAETAILQLLARYISGLNATRMLLYQGFAQEMGALFRMLDEYFEDILFLGLSINSGKFLSLRKDYLENFFQEEFDDPANAFRSTQSRKIVPRKKIHGALAHFGQDNLNPSDAKQNHRTMSQAYSGYVHGTSVHIIEMIEGDKHTYLLNGMRGTLRQQQRGSEYWNYASRGIDIMIMVCKVIGTEDLVDEAQRFRDYFESRTGQSSKGNAEALVKKMKRSR